MISYDTQSVAVMKSTYINQMNLGGAMWWELDADAPEDTGKALVRTVREQLGQLEWRQNELNYPGSSEWAGAAWERVPMCVFQLTRGRVQSTRTSARA